ncbi:hypothetical protein O9992_20385 [Vibrio lentus]|nr:hypothetical protein [Vibrio lentus]
MNDSANRCYGGELRDTITLMEPYGVDVTSASVCFWQRRAISTLTCWMLMSAPELLDGWLRSFSSWAFEKYPFFLSLNSLYFLGIFVYKLALLL